MISSGRVRDRSAFLGVDASCYQGGTTLRLSLRRYQMMSLHEEVMLTNPPSYRTIFPSRRTSQIERWCKTLCEKLLSTQCSFLPVSLSFYFPHPITCILSYIFKYSEFIYMTVVCWIYVHWKLHIQRPLLTMLLGEYSSICSQTGDLKTSLISPWLHPDLLLVR